MLKFLTVSDKWGWHKQLRWYSSTSRFLLPSFKCHCQTLFCFVSLAFVAQLGGKST